MLSVIPCTSMHKHDLSKCAVKARCTDILVVLCCVKCLWVTFTATFYHVACCDTEIQHFRYNENTFVSDMMKQEGSALLPVVSFLNFYCAC